MSLRAKLSALRVRVEPMTIAGIDEPIHVKGLTGGERAVLVSKRFRMGEGGPPLSDGEIAALGICDASGVRIYQDTDAPELDLMPGEVLSAIALRIMQLSGLTAEATTDAAKK